MAACHAVTVWYRLAEALTVLGLAALFAYGCRGTIGWP